jgi:hypothetical protein
MREGKRRKRKRQEKVEPWARAKQKKNVVLLHPRVLNVLVSLVKEGAEFLIDEL